MQDAVESQADDELSRTGWKRSALARRGRRNGDGLGWFGARVGGATIVALALFKGASASRGRRSTGLAAAGAAIAGAALLDALFGVRQRLAASPRAVSIRSSVTIRRSPDDIYRFWRDLRNLPQILRYLDEVTETNGHSVWRAKGPGGLHAEWEAEIVADRPGERIAWRSLEGATVPNHGSVEFRPAPRDLGTEVHLELVLEPPGGALGAGLLRLFEAFPEQMLKGDLRRLKQILETGDIARSDASIHRGMHPAQPPKPEETPLVNDMVQS